MCAHFLTATLSQSGSSSPCSRAKVRAVTSRSSSDALTKCQPCVILFYSNRNCFDQIEPSRSAMEHSGVRFPTYIKTNECNLSIFYHEVKEPTFIKLKTFLLVMLYFYGSVYLHVLQQLHCYMTWIRSPLN